MKKVLIVLAVLAFAVSTAFASVTSVTKEWSKCSYPAMLEKDSLNGSYVFLTDASNFGKVAMLEAGFSGTWALISNTVDFGQIIISSSPNPDLGSAVSLGLDKPSNVVGLQVLPKLDNIVAGIGLLIGKQDTTRENKDKEVAPLVGTADYDAQSVSYYGIQLGAKIEGISIGLKVRMAGESDQQKTYANVSPWTNVINDTKTDGSALGINVAAKMDVSDWTVALAFGTDSGERKIVTKIDANNDGDYSDVTDTNQSVKTVDSAMSINVLGGTTVGKGEKIAVDVATGIGYTSSQSSDTETKDEIANTTTYGGAQRSTQSDINWNLNVGVEANLNETWTVNAGTALTILGLTNRSTKTQKDADPTTSDYREQEVYSLLNLDNAVSYAIGLTGVIGALTIDLQLNPALILWGPEFISGVSGTGTVGPMNTQLALIYNY